ncbi:MAG: hypothetical protein K2J87_02910, partial [Muribaculaceae bacterium]|nr:hypothetical protein [Muribaculaceae bacterium]
YFKNNATGKYDRIRQFGIRVLNGDTREELPGEQGFVFGSDIRMRRSKPSAAGEYAEPENQFRYHSMLRKDNPGEGRYIVQVLAKDNNGNIINTPTGPMILMQYDIRFVGSSSASLLTDAELYDTDLSNKNNNRYRHARDEYLKEKYGDTQFKIDFDNYFEINKLTDETLKNKFISYSVPAFDIADQWYKDENKLNLVVWDHNSTNHLTSASKMQHAFYKWPIAWERSTYGFGYNYRYNYNMYMLATHSTNVPYHASADNWNANNDGDGIGLYDRLYYKTKRMREANPDKKIRQEQGYFYYVNAASDPGVSARINVDLPCAGSRVIVSAWVAEMTKGDANDDYEAANISFNFVAVMNETNERVVLHNFITGNIPGDKLGKWCNVYYSFIPRMSEFFNDTKTFKDVDHFELELAHNGESSVGADYAIDDIRAYVLPPAADASHDGFACDDVPLDLTIQASFETLLEKLGQAEGYGTADKKIDLYYAFVDKEKFEEIGSMNDATVGKVKFSNNFTKNDSYTDNVGNRLGNIANETAYRMTNESGDRMIVFETVADAGKLKIGKEYYVVFKSRLDDGDSSVGILPDSYDATTFFDLGEECSYNCILTVTPALEVKIDGVIQPGFNELEACENQMPVIQLNVWSTDKEPVEVMKNAYFDWFDGSINDFENYRFKDYPESLEVVDDYTEDADAHYLQAALNLFRARYPEAESVAGIKAETEKGDDDMMLEQWMLDIIDVASSPAANGLPKLVLHQASFVVPPVSHNEGAAATKARFVAIPIIDLLWENAPGETAGGKSVQVCKSPTEIGISVGDHTPVILHGLSDPALNYPAELYDVPLRLGLNQLYNNSEVTSAASELRKIDIPLRAVSSSDGKAKEFSLVNEETIINNEKVKRTGCILLAQTNDPEYRNLGTLNDSKEETEHLLWVGEIVEFNAYSSGNGAATSGERKHFTADFDRNFKFKEGYFYRFRYQFEENNDEEIDADDETICNGHDIFTIKVVPQYLKWNGDKNLSWDNDDNWMRVTSSEILKPDASADDYRFTDGGNANGRGFAPLDFTRVVIDCPDVTRDAEGNFIGADGENPWLYAPATDNVEMTDEYNAAVKNKWTSNPDRAEKPAEKIGSPTSLIQYDMTARESQSDEERLLCRPWQANRCKEIHFFPGATIMNQQVLNYEKAWVDVELDHSRWYILSTPLQDAYAGDFYLPTEKARQETEMFREITFDPAKNDRFAPAVYQRGWDKSTANVYEFGTNDARNVAVKTFWSRVYNDATEDYGNGKAFSIKTDVSNANNAGDKVIFRLPKGDETYFYYKQDGTTDNKETAALNRENSHRLNVSNGTMTVTTANEGKYFLVGNPFMTYMDIKGFLSRNQDKLEQKYWVVTKDGQIAGSFSGENNFIASPYPESDSPEDATAIAPMQGFFVESKKVATSLDLEYDETMMRRDHKDGSILSQGTRSGDEPSYLRITSIS